MHAGRGGRRTPPGATVAVCVVVVLAAAALLLRPAARLLAPGRGPLGGTTLVVIALVAAWAGASLFLVRRLRPRIGGDPRAMSPYEERLRQIAVPLLLVAPFALGVLALVLHRFPPRRPGPPDTPVKVRPSAPVMPSLRPHPGSESGHLPLYLGVVVLAALLLVVAVVLVVRWLRGRTLTLPQLPARPAAEEDTERELLLSAVRDGRRALADGADARAAVIACYAAMEDALAASGLSHRASDSPADLLARASGAGLLTGPAAPRLTALFREARYSSHPMDDSRRLAAADALEEIAELLRERRGQEVAG
ncbi:DUF4129 domain-containing protein [Streptomyces sp. VRA16 Mangrove soil]|uniref:DUF4129 domain-containing protein n=1 Tax=Streptomyces sp. VRA16 Mangrove soil TaxID=2817434 RepID=UPI001A9EA020|nr:DUF4129 domain-containing protein [Streptomyces sp. VRA16 Mangrove soil]MBO1329649.1 DUF4129 domain-containing protein [Streptomyces sp. VRA16 Mangrove soil]